MATADRWRDQRLKSPLQHRSAQSRLFGTLDRCMEGGAVSKRGSDVERAYPALSGERTVFQVSVWRPSDYVGVSWSPNAKFIAAAGGDGCIWVFDLGTGETRVLGGHQDEIWAVAWSPDARIIASGSHDQTVKLWDVYSGALIHTLTGHTDQVRAIAWSPDGHFLASGSGDRTIRVWNPSTGKLLRTLKGHARHVWTVAWSPDSRVLASGSLDRTIRFWDPNSRRSHQIASISVPGLKTRNAIRGVAWSPDGNRLVSISDDRALRVWNAQDRSLLHTLPGEGGWLSSIACSSDGALAYASDDYTLKIWEPLGDAAPSTLNGKTGWVRGLAWSPDGLSIAASTDADNAIGVWERSTGEVRIFLEGWSGVGQVTWSHDWQALSAVGPQRSITILGKSRVSGTVLKETTDRVLSVAWSNDKCTLAFGGENGEVGIRNANDGTLIRSWKAHSSGVTAVQYSVTDTLLASGCDNGEIGLWDFPSSSLKQMLAGHTSEVLSLAWHPQRTLLASGGADRTLRIWDADLGQPVRVLEGHTSAISQIAWAPSGDLIVSSGSDGELRIWHLTSGEMVGQRDRLPFRELPTAIGFGPVPSFVRDIPTGVSVREWTPTVRASMRAKSRFSPRKLS